MASEETEKSAIRELLATYCFHLDNYRFADMGRCSPRAAPGIPRSGKGTGRAGIVAQGINRHARTARPEASCI